MDKSEGQLSGKKKYFVCITYLNEQSYNNNKIHNGVMGTTYLDIYNGGLL